MKKIYFIPLLVLLFLFYYFFFIQSSSPEFDLDLTEKIPQEKQLQNGKNKMTFDLDAYKGDIKGYDSKRNLLWSMNFTSPITAINSSKNYCIFATLEGKVYLFDQQGLVSFVSLTKNEQVVYGIAMAPDETHFALIKGYTKQSLLIYRVEEQGKKATLEYEYPLNSQFTRPVHLIFSNKGENLMVEQSSSLVIYNLEEGSFSSIPLKPPLIWLSSDFFNQISFLTEGSKGGSLFYTYTLSGDLLYKEAFSFLPDSMDGSFDSLLIENAQKKYFIQRGYK